VTDHELMEMVAEKLHAWANGPVTDGTSDGCYPLSHPSQSPEAREAAMAGARIVVPLVAKEMLRRAAWEANEAEQCWSPFGGALARVALSKIAKTIRALPLPGEGKGRGATS